MKTFHESKEDGEVNKVFRLSYQGNSHYNSIIPADWEDSNMRSRCFYDPFKEGEVEREAIKWSQER
jgi:hypothetical protein